MVCIFMRASSLHVLELLASINWSSLAMNNFSLIDGAVSCSL